MAEIEVHERYTKTIQIEILVKLSGIFDITDTKKH